MLNLQNHLQSPSTPLPPRPSLDTSHLRQRLTPAEARKWSGGAQLQHPVLPRLHRPRVDSVTSTSEQLIPGRVFWLGGWLMAFCTVALGVSGLRGQRAQAGHRDPDLCETVVAPNAVLSRDQLAQLLTLPERSPSNQVRERVAQPYCQLADLEVRAEVMAQREAYPLAFDPQTWLILLFEGEEYAGYAFAFQP